MIKSINVVEQHHKYSAAAVDVKEAIDEAFQAVANIFRAHGLGSKMADEAEEMVAAIHHYYERSSRSRS